MKKNKLYVLSGLTRDYSSFCQKKYKNSEDAVEKLAHILKTRGQFLPIITSSKRKKYIGYYPTNPLVNMIDIEKSGMS